MKRRAQRAALAAMWGVGLCATAWASGCGLDTDGLAQRADAGVDSGARDGGRDAGRDDAALVIDAGGDAGGDASVAFDAGTDAGVPFDAGVDAGTDAGPAMDAGMDAGTDAGPPDAGLDAGPQDAGFPDAAETCATSGVRSCIDEYLMECVASVPTVVERCVLGCTSIAGTARCLRVRPTNVTDATLLVAGTAAVGPSTGHGLVFDTETGAITNDLGVTVRAAGMAGDVSGIVWRRQRQGGTAPDLSIFAMASLTVPVASRVTATGSAALVILSSGSVRIDGRVDLGGVGRSAGPGGRAGALARADALGDGGGHAGGLAGVINEIQAGGGGGGHTAVGGAGGDQNVPLYATATGGAGGAVVADPDGSPLTGGGAGGGGAGPMAGGVGGGGGGALQITSNAAIVVGAGAVVTVAGAGGGVGTNSGGGGGAGGVVLLEALSVLVDGAVVANGGGGGGSDVSLIAVGSDGERGRDDATPARGGDPAGLAAGRGGIGGAGAAIAGGAGADDAGGAGGGGGAAGRLRFVTIVGGVTVRGVASPSEPVGQTRGLVTGI